MKKIILSLLGIVGLTACSSQSLVRTALVREHDFVIAVEQRKESDTTAPPISAKPAMIVVSDIKKLMGDLQYTEKAGLAGKALTKAVFQKDEIDRLAPALTASLAKAATTQRIRFISFNHAQGVLFSESQKTEGVIFIATDGRLNVAFNYINAKRLPSETSALASRYSEIDPMGIDLSETPVSSTAAYIELSPLATGKPAPMWVAADLGKLREAATSPAIFSGAATEANSPAESLERAATSRPETASGSETSTAPSRPADDPSRQELKTKLKYLKELVDEGLISESDYDAKKLELLRKID